MSYIVRWNCQTGDFPVTISEGEDMKPCTYVISVGLARKLELQPPDAYLKGRRQSIPRDILEGMDIIVRENPRRNQMTMGRGYYSGSPGRNSEIGDGIIACRGFQQSLKPTSQGLSMCVDYMVMPFYKPVPELQFLHEHLNIQFDRYNQLNRNHIRRVEMALKGLKVRVTHRKTSQKFTIVGLTRLNTSRIAFELVDSNNAKLKRNVALVDYFKER